MTTPLNEICPELPLRFAQMVATLNEGGVVWGANGAVVATAVDGLREELLVDVERTHGSRGKDALAFARATLITELLLRSQVMAVLSSMIAAAHSADRARVHALTGSPTEDVLEEFDQVAGEAVGRQYAARLLSRELFAGKPFLLNTEQTQLDELARCCDGFLEGALVPVLGPDFREFIREGAEAFGALLSKELISNSQKSAVAALLAETRNTSGHRASAN